VNAERLGTADVDHNPGNVTPFFPLSITTGADCARVLLGFFDVQVTVRRDKFL